MGQRTQIFIISTDKFNNHRVEVYHDQWGIGRRMPMLSMGLLSKLYCAEKRSWKKDSIFLDLCKVNSGEYGVIHTHTLDYNSNGELVSVKTETGKMVKGQYHYYFGKIRSKKDLNEYPQNFDYWLDTNTYNFGDFADGFCDNNNGVMVMYCTESKDPDSNFNCLYDYKIGFLEGREDDGEFGDAFSRWLSPEEWSDLAINHRYMKDFLDTYKSFLEWYEVKTYPSVEEKEVEAY